jgi:hypothetical protein
MFSTDLNPRYEPPAAKARVDSYPPGTFNKNQLKGLRGTSVLIPKTGGAKKPFRPTDQWGNIVASASKPRLDTGGFNKGQLKELKGVSVVIPKAPTHEYAEKTLQDHFGSESDPSKMNDLIRGQPLAMEEFRQKYSKATTDRIMKDLTSVLVEEYGDLGITALKNEDWDDVKEMLGASVLIDKMPNKQEIRTFVSSIPSVTPPPASPLPASPLPASSSLLPPAASRSDEEKGVQGDEKKDDEIIEEWLAVQKSNKEQPFSLSADDVKNMWKPFEIDKKFKNTKTDMIPQLMKQATFRELVVNRELTPSVAQDIEKRGIQIVMQEIRDARAPKIAGSGMRGSGSYHSRTHFVAKHTGMRDYL